MAGEPHLIHLDAVGGIAGDMFVAALLDALPDLVAPVLADVAAVLPAEVGTAELLPGTSAGIAVRRFRLSPGRDRPHGGHGTTFAALRRRIACAPLAPGTAERAVAILTLLAEAEAAIHGVPLDDVHFHEVGDWDSLMDVVAAGSIAARLPGARWTVSELPRGGGLVRTAHGLLPVPAPATVRLLEGFAFRDDGIAGERVTPTGAAILRHLAGAPSRGPLGRLVAAGTGAGTRELPGLPNVLRATIYAAESSGADEDTVDVLTFDVDDMTGEEIATAADRLRAADGVRDLTTAALTGKKGRPVTRFEILVDPALGDIVVAECFRQTATLGLRIRTERRAVLRRAAATRDGLRVKIAERPDGPTAKAESDDLTMETLAARRAAARRVEGTDD